MTSLAARRRIDSARPSRQDRLANRFVHDTSDEESEDEETRLQREEEEQERLLSEANGEAAEAPATTKTQTDQEIEAEYATTAKKRKPRLTLQPKHVIGADGLLKIRSDFVALKKPKTLSIDAAASYSRRLVLKYKSWAYDLFPSLAFEDVLSRVETFGPKREVKAHLQSMRNDVRNAYLEKVMGKDLATRMIDELEDGLRQQQEVVGQEVAPEEESAPPAITPVEPRITRATTTETARTPPAAIVDSDSEEELEFARAPTVKTTKPTAADFMDSDDEEEIGAKPSKTTAALVDTDDEGEDEVPTPAAEKAIPEEHDPKDLQGDSVEQEAESNDKVASADEEEVSVNNDTNHVEQAEATSVASAKETNVHDDDIEMEDNEEVQTVTTTQSEVAEPVPTETSTTASQLERSPCKSQTQDDVTADVESPQTQATVLASQLESVAKTQNEATPPSPTQATVLASQLESSPEQLTQATILASQTQQELSTQATVLATQEQTQATVIASQLLVEPTQATVLASQLETQEDLVSQTQATVLASPESDQDLPTQTQEEPALDTLIVTEFQTQND